MTAVRAPRWNAMIRLHVITVVSHHLPNLLHVILYNVYSAIKLFACHDLSVASSSGCIFTPRNLPPALAFPCPPLNGALLFYCDEETGSSQKTHYSTYRSSAGSSTSPLHYLLPWRISPALQLYRGVPLWFNCDMCIHIVQTSYSQPDDGFFFTETCTACDILLQILKSEPA